MSNEQAVNGFELEEMVQNSSNGDNSMDVDMDSTADDTMSQSEPLKRCTICLQEMVDPATGNGCTHEFCFSCIQRWTENNPSCPLCKTSIASLSHNIGDETETVMVPVQLINEQVNIINNVPTGSSIEQYAQLIIEQIQETGQPSDTIEIFHGTSDEESESSTDSE